MWAILGRDGQLMSEQETLLHPEVMMMTMMTKMTVDTIVAFVIPFSKRDLSSQFL
jgi:hypothetical protein